MKIVFKEPEENPEERVYLSSLEVGTLLKIGEEVFFVSSDSAYENRKLMTRLDTGVTYTIGFNYIDKKDIIKTSTLIIER